MILTEVLTTRSKNQRGLTSSTSSVQSKVRNLSRLLLLFLLISVPQLLQAQFTEQIGQDVTGAVERGLLGDNVKFSGDGTTFITVEYIEEEDNDDVGIISVYQQQSGTWILMGATISTEDVDDEIVALAISDDGQTIAIGNAHDSTDQDREGSVKIYTFIGGDWVQQGNTLKGNNIYDHFGISIDFSADATYLVVGAIRPREESDDPDNIRARAGYVETYKKGTSGWSQVGGQLLSGLDEDTFGNTVKLSGDASRLFVSNWISSSADGNTVFTYKNENDTWSETGSIDGTGGLHGFDIAASSNGEILAIASYSSSSVGAVDVYKLRTDALGNPEWAAMGGRLEGASRDGFGNSIDLAPAGYTLFVGVPNYQNEATDEVGAVKVYNFTGGDWVMQNLQVIGQRDGDDLGHAVSASNDGLILAVGAPGVDANGVNGAGLVRVLADCPAGVTCTTQDVAVCGLSYDFSNGTSATTDGRYDIFESPTERVSYLLTFQSTEQVVDIFQDATIAESGSVTYQANTNATGVLSFDKSQSNWVNLNSLADDLDGESRSIFLWVKSEANVTSTHQSLFAINTSSGDNVSLLWIDDDSDNLELNRGGTSNESASFNMGGEVWHYVGYSYNASTNETVVYVNGIENDRFTHSQATDAGSQYSLGQEFDGGSISNPYNGDMAEISVWDEVLTPAEIRAAMRARITNAHTAYDHLVGYYSIFGECNDDVTVLKDHSGKGNDGTFENGLTQDFQNVQSIEGFNAIGWYDVFSWKKDGVEVSTTNSYTTDVVIGNYQFTASRPFVQSSDTWRMSLNENAATVDNITDEILCADDPNTRSVPVNAVNYIDFEETEDRYVSINGLSDQLAGKSRSVFMWFNLESEVTSGNFNELLVFQGADVDSISRFYIRETERLALVDGKNSRINSTTDLDEGTWYFIGYTYDHDAKEGKVYVNGTEEGSGTMDMPLDRGWLAILGAKYNDNGLEDHLDGQMAELTIWDKVLTPEEIATLMGTAPSSDATDLVASYGTLPGIADDQMRDLTANGIDGLTSHIGMTVDTAEVVLEGYDASANYTFIWKKGETEFDTDAIGNINIEEGNTAYSVTYGTPLFQKTDAFSLSYTNLIPTQPTGKTVAATANVTFEVENIPGASYQWYKREEGFDQVHITGDLLVRDIYRAPDGTIYNSTSTRGIYFTPDVFQNRVIRNTTHGLIKDDIAEVRVFDGDIYAVNQISGVSISTDGGDSFSTLFDQGTSRTVHKMGQTIYIGHNSGLYVSTNGGTSFSLHSDVSGSVDVIYEADGILYVGSYEGLFISDDNGSTFTKKTTTDGLAFIRIRDVHKSGNIIYVSTQTVNSNEGAISVSTDGGATFTKTITEANGIDGHLVDAIYVFDGDLLVGTSRGLFVSKDQGDTFTQFSTPEGTFTSKVITLTEYNGQLDVGTDEGMFTYRSNLKLENQESGATNLIAGATTHQLTISKTALELNGAVYFVEVTKDNCVQESDDLILTVLDVPAISIYTPENGSTGVAIDTELRLRFNRSINIRTGEIKIFNYATDALVQTFTAGDLTKVGTEIRITSGVSLDYASQYYVTIDADLVIDDSNAGNLAITDKDTWSFHTACEELILTEPEDQTGIIAGSATFSVPQVAGASYQWYQPGGLWRDFPDHRDEFGQNSNIYVDSNKIYLATNGDGLFISEDDGKSWTNLKAGMAGFPNDIVNSVLAINEVIYIGTEGGIGISTDGGTNWTTTTKNQNGFANSNGVNDVFMYGSRIYVATDAGISISTDGGANWTTSTTVGLAGTQKFTDIYAVGDYVYAGGDETGLVISANNGIDWTTVDSGENGFASSTVVNDIVATGNSLYVGTEGGLSISHNKGDTWNTILAADFLSFAGSSDVRALSILDEEIYLAHSSGISISSNQGVDWESGPATVTGTSSNFRNVFAKDDVLYGVTLDGVRVFSDRTEVSNNTDASAINSISGSSTRELTIANLSEALSQSEYFVVVTKGECEETSEIVTLSIVEGISRVSVSPENNATNVAIDTDLSITYDLDFTKGTGSLRIFDYATEAEVAAIPAVNATITDKTLTFTGISLQTSTQYYITLDEGLVLDGANNSSVALSDKDTWTFFTVCETLVLSQPITQSVPIGGAATFTVPEVAGASYQWFKKEENVININDIETTVGLTSGFVASSSANGGVYYMASGNRQAFLTKDRGTSWEPATTTRSGSYIYAQGNNVYQGGIDGIALSFDGGETFKEISVGQNGLSGSPGGTWNVLGGSGDNVYVYHGTTFYVSTDRGESFTPKTIIADGFNGQNPQDIKEYDGVLYLAAGNGLYISTDNGDSFIRKTTEDGLNSNDVTSISKVNGIIYLTAYFVGRDTEETLLNYSTDNGESFTTVPISKTGNVRDLSVANDGTIYLATPDGIKVSKDNAQTFSTLTTEDGLGSNDVKNVNVGADNTIYANTAVDLSILSNNASLSDDSDPNANNQITGATTNQLTINNLTEALDQTQYFVVVTKGDCEETSEVVTLSVVEGLPTSNPFVFTVNVSEADESFEIPIIDSFTYDYFIDWGDGFLQSGQTTGISHAYSESGSYDIKIYGAFPAISLDGNTNAEKVTDIKAWGDISWESMNGAFAGTRLSSLSATDAPDLSKVTDLHRVFASTDLFNSDLSSWDVSTVTDMSEAFRQAKIFNGDVSNWNVANVTTMSGMFKDAKQINQDLSGWDVSAVQNMNELFANANAFNGDVTTWNVSNVTDMTAVFDDCKVFNQDISGWDVSNVTTMEDLFNSAEIFNQDISNWDVSKVTNMESAFQAARAFNVDISSWQVGNVTDMDRMFSGARMFNQNIDSWDVNKVTSMQSMFSNAFAFNQDLNSWNVANVTNMSQMFRDASVFDGNISGWEVSAVTTMSEMFSGASSFNQDVSGWNVSASLNFGKMFKDATKFDQNLGSWNIKPALEDDTEALADMFDGTALSTSNYDNTLIGWAAINDLPSEAYLSDVPATFCASETQRDFLLNTLSWEINDEGKANNCFAEPDAVTLDSFVPANGATDVAVTANIALTFSENVQAYVYGEAGTAVNDIVLYDGAGNEVERFPANSLTYSAATVTIDPTADLGYSQTYYLLIDTEAFIANTDAKFAGVTDVNAIRFTTEAKPNTAPVASAQDFTGNLEVNQQVTGSYTYTDAESDPESGTQYGWLVADDASGANQEFLSDSSPQSITLTENELGKFLAFAVLPSDGQEFGEAVFTDFRGPVATAVIPTVVSTVPVDGAVDIAISDNLSFTMSEAVTKGNGNIILTPTNGGPTVINISSSAVTVSGTNVTIDPTTDLLEGQFYTVTFNTTAFVDADGNNSAGLSSQTTWNFTTKAAQVAPVASTVIINRSTVVNAPLEGSYSYSDGNDDPESGSTYQWYRADDASGTNKTVISGATSEDYVAQATEHNKYVSFEVTPNDGNQVGTAVESAFFGPVLVDDGVTNIPPAFTSEPLVTILDNVTYSYTITTEDRNSHAVSLTKTTGPAWLTLSGGVLSGDPAGQVGDHIIVLTADDGNGGTKTQEFTITVEASNTAPSVNGIEVSGTTTIDEQLTGTYNFIDAENDADNSSYKWYRADDNGGTNKTAIAGATATTYTLTSADAGKFISFEVTPNDGKVDGTLAESSVVGAVAKKTPTLSLADITKIYGDGDFDLSATTNSSGAITYSFDNDQTSASISGATVTLGEVGEIAVDVSLAEDAEYQARQVHSKITIDKRAIEVTATDASKNVGEADPVLAFIVTNGAIVGSDNVVTVGRVAGESVGTYSMTFTDGADAVNYEISKVNGTFTINANAITVTADVANKTYGDNDPQFTFNITSGALNAGDELMGGISRVVGEGVGTYALENSLFNADYDITFVGADLTIEKAELTATADDQTRFIGEANPALTISYSGFMNGDTEADITAPTASTTADVNSTAGTYDITLSGGSATNYNISLVNGTLTVEQRPFITTWDIVVSDFRNGDRVFFITSDDYTYNYNIDWGDGTIETGLTDDASHSYATDGIYTVKITGDFPHFSTDYFRFASVEQWGDIAWESMEESFFRDEFSINATDTPDLSGVTSMKAIFSSAKIGSPDLSSWNVSTITNMSEAFSNSDFNGNVSTWNVSNVTDMSSMFGSTPFNGDISNWNVGKVTTMRSMFIQATAFNGDLSNWNMSSVTNTESMFNNADAFNGDISAWNVSSVTDMTGMFSETDLFNQDISSWNVSNVVDMASMFSGTKAFNQPLDDWDVSNVTTMEIMFRNADAFNQDLNSWNVSKVKKFDEMFKQTALFNGNITAWNVSSGEDFEEMFQETEAFNQPIGDWDLASATRVRRMFRDAEVFNQPINDWRFPNLESLEQMFWGALVFNQDLNDWDVSNITDMASTFEEAEAFNGNISNWDVSKVEDFDEFMNATPFNQDISGWNVSSATDFGRMFEDSPNFNQDLSSWDMSKATDVAYMFEGATSFNQDISSWQLTSVTSFDAMLKLSGMSIANYDAFLMALAQQDVVDDVYFDTEGLQYCAGKAARQQLIDEQGWDFQNDSQSCTATVTIADVSGNEDDGNITVTLTSDAFVVDGFTVDVSTADGTATAGTDYTAVTAQTITFAGSLGETQTFTITPTADTNVEVNETLTVSMGNLVTGTENTVTITDQATVTIVDDDQPIISFTSAEASNSESVANSSIEVNLDQAGLTAVTVDYSVTGTATGNGTDYTLANGTLSFATGDQSETINLIINDDALIEADETVIITLSNASGASIGSNAQFTYTIANNDAQVTIEDVSQVEDGEAFLITATLEGNIAGGFSVDVVTTDGTATVADGDYVPTAGSTLTFAGADGETQSFDITPVADQKLEADETFTVSMSNLAGTTADVVMADQATLTINNDDAAAITIADASGNEGDGPITVTVTLDNAVQGGFTVAVSTADGTATTTNSDYTAISAEILTFAGVTGETQTFTVVPTNDIVIENDETLTVNLSDLSTALAIDITDDATVTIINDDFNNTPTDITLSATNITENGALDATIGSLSTTDADAGDTHTYSLVAGMGDVDNGFFVLDGADLKANNLSYNFEFQSSYSIRIQTDDGKGGVFAKAFIIGIIDVNEAPFQISLSNNSITESDEAQEVGMLMTLDPDAGETFTYAFVEGEQDAHNAQFEIVGNTVRTAGAINFEEGASRDFRVRVTDSGGLSFEWAFTVIIEDVVEEPVRDFSTNVPGGDVKNVFSPNGDGINETWVIEDLQDNPVNEVRVFAQGGKLLYSQVNYQNDWDGTFKGDPIPDGTYYYEITIFATSQSNEPARIIKGFLTIIRSR